jgi:hypothetical protein
VNASIRNCVGFVAVSLVTYLGWSYGGLAWYTHVVFGGALGASETTEVRFWLLSAAFNFLLFGCAGVLITLAVNSSKPTLWAALLGIAFAIDALIGTVWKHAAYTVAPGPTWLVVVLVLPTVSCIAGAAATRSVRRVMA